MTHPSVAGSAYHSAVTEMISMGFERDQVQSTDFIYRSERYREYPIIGQLTISRLQLLAGISRPPPGVYICLKKLNIMRVPKHKLI